jgi:type II secretory pathway component GspD/PulD (secretin)
MTLNESLAIGLALGNFDNGAIISNFGGTPTGLDGMGGVDIPGAAGAAVGAGGSFALFSSDDLPIPLIIQALATDTRARVLSRPSLLTNDNQEAIISTETETAYETSTILASGNESRSFETVTAGITLRVSPTISAGNYLRLRVRIEVSNFEDSRSGIEGAPPDILRREIETPVTVPDGHTIILGGLVSKASGQTKSKVPWLGDLPVIGWLFRSNSERTEDRYLYVFITPHIIDTDFALLDEISAARRFDYDRLGGDISDLAAQFGSQGINADMRQIGPTIQYVFDMPTTAFPGAGDQDAVNQYTPPPMAEPQPQPMPQPAPPPTPAEPTGDPGFDDVFGFGGAGSGN